MVVVQLQLTSLPALERQVAAGQATPPEEVSQTGDSKSLKFARSMISLLHSLNLPNPILVDRRCYLLLHLLYALWFLDFSPLFSINIKIFKFNFIFFKSIF